MAPELTHKTKRKGVTAMALATGMSMLGLAACGGGQSTGGDYYEGKTIEITVPFGPGGGSDNSARLLVKFLEGCIPGDPTIQAVNVDGGGSILGANEYALQAEDDGTALLITSTSTILPWVLGQDAVKYDFQDMQLLWGHPAGRTVYASEGSGVTSVQDVENSAEPLIAGGRGPTAADLEFLVGLEVLGLREQIKMIFGYEDGGTQALAFEQGETNVNHQPTGSLVAEDWHLIEDGGAALLYTHGLIEGDSFAPDPALPEVPTIVDVYEELRGGEPSGEAWEAFKTLEALIQGTKYGLWLKDGAPEEASAALNEGIDCAVSKDEYTPEAHALLGPYEPVMGEGLTAYQEVLQDLDPEQLTWLREFVSTNYDIEGLGD